MKSSLVRVCVSTLVLASGCPTLATEQAVVVAPDSAGDTRYGLFNWLDHRSQYGQGVYPEPFLVDDSDLEPAEARLDWLHTEITGSKTDVAKAEIEKGFGLMTLELEVPYEWDRSGGYSTHGFNNIDVGARYPIYQFVSRDGLVDLTAGAAIEVGIPTDSVFSKNAELVPKIFYDLKVGNLTVQNILGYSALFGPGDDGGLQSFEYGFVFGYTIERRQLPLPGVLQLVPYVELLGETELNKDNPGHNTVVGDAGFRFNLRAIGPVQPRPGVGFVFPIDSGGRQEMDWGVIVSLVAQF